MDETTRDHRPADWDRERSHHEWLPRGLQTLRPLLHNY